MPPEFSLRSYIDTLQSIEPLAVSGPVVRTVGLVVESNGPRARVGELCDLIGDGRPPIAAEVVGFRDNHLLTVPLDATTGIRSGDRVVSRGVMPTVAVGSGMLGRVIDGLGRPIDDLGRLATSRVAPLYPPPMNPLSRAPIEMALGTGVRAIDALLTAGRGQRLGLFGGSGVGKSTLMGMLARGTEADAIVIGLVGERGREVRSFLEHDLGPEGLARAVVVVSTSDSPALVRMRAAHTATAIAESLRDDGKHVLLLMDSVTRYAMAQREVGLAAGEPPTTKGYPPSVFAMLPGLLERAGNVRGSGSITGFYTVLVEGDDHNDPIADSVRAIVDGHIVLSRDLGMRNHYPAIDVLASVSRTMPDVVSPEHRTQAGQVREWMATLRDHEDLVSVGAYVAGTQPRVDAALARREAIGAFLRQPADGLVTLPESIDALMRL